MIHSTLRLILITALVLPVGIVMLTAGAIVFVLTLARWPFFFLQNTCSRFLEALLRELAVMTEEI